jgi:hypothetical protein
MESKKCGKCKISKGYEYFYTHKKNKDGLSYNCKKCINIQRKEHYSNNKVQISEYNKYYREKTKENGFALYYLPEEHYVGFTNHLKARLRRHKCQGKITEGYEVIGVYSCPIYTHLLETRLHLMGYNGFQHKY